LKANNFGRVFDSSAEYRFLEQFEGGNRRAGRQPDISFVGNERLPARFRSYPDIVPDMVIEVESPTDKPYHLEAKIEQYRKAGVKLIWLVHPYTRTVDVYSSGNQFKRYNFEEELDGDKVLPGFKLKVNDIFDFPADPNPDPDK
jgi:Uma2 family endonuclease